MRPPRDFAYDPVRNFGFRSCVAAAQIVAVPAAAEDLQPPPWRGEWSTTSQIWEFDRPQQNPIPPDGPAPGGMPPLPSTEAWVFPMAGADWLPEDQGRFGVWPLSGWLEVLVDNHDPKPENIKLIWVQLTWRPQDPGDPLGVPTFTYFQPPPATVPKIIEEVRIDDLWRETTYYWELDWNPPDEMFTIEGNINVDELVVDTWCVPEPVTLSLLAVGGLALLRRRR